MYIYREIDIIYRYRYRFLHVVQMYAYMHMLFLGPMNEQKDTAGSSQIQPKLLIGVKQKGDQAYLRIQLQQPERTDNNASGL